MKYLAKFKSFISRKNLKNSILELEGLRFFSILLVFLQHFSDRVNKYGQFHFPKDSFNHQFSYFLSRGTIGVFIFFAISGYVLTLPWINEKNSLKSNYKSFITRRFRRIEPPYLIWMSIFFIVLFLKSSIPAAELIKHYLTSILYIHNIVYQDHSILNPVAWSLEVELQFYLIAPIIVKLLWSIKNTWNRILLIFLTIIGFQFIQYNAGWWKFPHKITLLGALPHFLTGILMVNIVGLEKPIFKKSYLFDLLFILSWVSLSYLWSTELLKNVLFNLILSVLILSSFYSIIINRFLKFGLVVLIGGMCYSIYLTHLPFMEFIFQTFLTFNPLENYWSYFSHALILTLAITIIISVFSFLFIEKPFMQYSESIIPFMKEKLNYPFIKKISKKIVLPIIMLLLLTDYVVAQDSSKKIQLLPLEQLIDSAVSHSPTVLKQNSKQEIIKQQTKLSNKSWLNHIAITGNTLYGSGTIVDNQLTANNQVISFQNSKSVNYSVGMSMRIPISSIFNTRNEKKILNQQSKIIDFESQENIKMLINEISLKYYTLLNYLDQIELSAESMEANRMKMELSEKFFKSGKLDIGIYKTDLDNYYMSKAKYLELSNKCSQELFQLKQLVGSEIILNKN